MRIDDDANEALIDRFYDRLSRLRDEPATHESCIEEALSLIVTLSLGRLAYIEVRSQEIDIPFTRGHGCNDEDLRTIRATLSTTIIEHVIGSNEPLILASAIDDERFADISSVKQNNLRQVIVFPVGEAPPCGVVYLQGGQEPLKASTQARVAHFARSLGPIAHRLLGQRRSLDEEEREFRRMRVLDALSRHDWNYAHAADDLGVARSHVYRLVHQYRVKKPD